MHTYTAAQAPVPYRRSKLLWGTKTETITYDGEVIAACREPFGKLFAATAAWFAGTQTRDDAKGVPSPVPLQRDVESAADLIEGHKRGANEGRAALLRLGVETHIVRAAWAMVADREARRSEEQRAADERRTWM